MTKMTRLAGASEAEQNLKIDKMINQFYYIAIVRARLVGRGSLTLFGTA